MRKLPNKFKKNIPKNYLMFYLSTDEIDYIHTKCHWDDDVDTERFGELLAMVAKGLLNKFVEQRVIDHANKSCLFDEGEEILESARQHCHMIDEMVTDMEESPYGDDEPPVIPANMFEG